MAVSRVHRCAGCGLLLLAGQRCAPCEDATVHVITDLGADLELPGVRHRALLFAGPIGSDSYFARVHLNDWSTR